MKKDKEWAFIELGKLFPSHAEMYDYPDDITVMKCELLNKVYDILSQLDEPEVLSQELPVIPKFVAEWYESEGNRNSWWNWFYKWGRDEGRTELETKTIRWMQYFNEEKFVDIFKRGYKVEEEQKYYVLDSEDIPLLEIANNQTCKTTTGLSIYEDGRDNSRFELTEQEIKDYDPRYWPFAVKVKELE